jgi:GcrA cell cycle regulator
MVRRVHGVRPPGWTTARKDSAKSIAAGKRRWVAMTWTDERVELLKKLWADGLSASRIAAELGGVSRNSVIGKVHRLGLSGRAKSASASVPRQRKPRTHQHMMRLARPGVRGNTALAPMQAIETDLEPEPEVVENIIPMGQRCSILQLSESTCRWPIGDPSSADFFFCGGKSIEGLPYCGYHSRIAYQPVSERRRDKRPERG